MKAVVHGEHHGFDQLIERRRQLGQDGYDEVWNGVYHMAAPIPVTRGLLQVQLAMLLGPAITAKGLLPVLAFNLGPNEQSYRVPHFGALESSDGIYAPTAAMVGEILSPDVETYTKFPFYHACGVKEIVVVDPGGQQVMAYGIGTTYTRQHVISCAGIDAEVLSGQIDWP